MMSVVGAVTGMTAPATPLCAQSGNVAAHTTADDAHTADAILARRVTITLQRVSLERALDSVARVAKVLIQYQAPAFNYSPVTIQVANTPLGDVLERILSGTHLRIIPDSRGKLVVVEDTAASESDSTRATGTITGRVTDSVTGRGLSGATVKVQGMKSPMITTDNGRFTVPNVPVGDQVVTVRAFGYRPGTRQATVTDGSSVALRFLMTPAPNVLSGVVTTATGQQRKIEVGNDITTLNVDSIRKTAPVTSVTDLLEARVPGMTVLHSSGAPGDPSRIRLRGAGSINENNDPIVIVDGIRVYAAQSDARNVNLATGQKNSSNDPLGGAATAAPSPLDQIDPASIATIEVFKGPSAASMYGSDAANGVIVITTKKGQVGTTHWNSNLAAGINYMPGEWPTNHYRFGYGASSNGSAFCAWNDLTCTEDSVVAYQALNNPRTTLFASHGGDQRADITVSGGSTTLLYSLTASGSGTQGIAKLPEVDQARYTKFYNKAPDKWMLRPDKYTTYGGSGQVTVQPSPTFQVTARSSLFQSEQQRSNLENGISNVQSTYFFSDQLGLVPTVENAFVRITEQSLTWTNGVSMNWTPMSWLPITATGGINAISRNDEALLPYGIVGAVSSDTTGYYSLGRGNSTVKTVNAGSKVPLLGGRLSSAFGFNFTSQSIADFTAAVRALTPGVNRPSTFPQQCVVRGQITDCSLFGQSSSATSTYGWYVEPRLNMFERFFLSPGFRLDGGSASGGNAGLTGFPKIDLSYVAVNREGARPLGGVLSLLRPRIAFGYAGVQPGPTDKLRLLTSQCSGLGCANSQNITLDGTTFVSAEFLNTLGNTLLRPERSSEVEGGFDMDLWQDRVQFTGTHYDKIRHDAILSILVAPSVYGTQSQNVNIGVIRNTGTELQLTGRVFESQAFSWDLSTTWSHNVNRVVRLNPGFRSDYYTGIVAGYPLFSRWAKPIVSYADVDGNGIITQNEVRVGDSSVYVGQQDPKYLMTVNSGVTFAGRLSLNTTLVYQNGINQFNASLQSSVTAPGGFYLLPNAPGTTLATQAAVEASTGGLTPIGLMQTVSQLRWQSLSISYVLPRSVAKALRVPHTSVALQGSNLWLHSNYRGKDPNVNAFSSAAKGDQVQDSGQLPQPRTWWLRFSLGN